MVSGAEGLNRLERLDLIKDLLLPGIEVSVYARQELCYDDSLWIRELKREAKPIKSMWDTIDRQHCFPSCISIFRSPSASPSAPM